LGADMKDKLMILSLKKAFSMKKEEKIISFIFDETELSLDDKKDLIQNSLIFNVTVEFKKIVYTYKIKIKFNERSKNTDKESQE
jgi:hypothetical protein